LRRQAIALVPRLSTYATGLSHTVFVACAVTDAAPCGDGFDLRDLADDFKIYLSKER
jgi:hypothetical protein